MGTLERPAIRMAVRRSLLLELLWITLVAPEEKGEDEYPARIGRFAAAPGLEERVKRFWGDGEKCFLELFVVADRAGVVFEADPACLLDGLAAGAVAPPRFEELASETPEDQVRFRSRIARLHGDPDLRAGWLELMADCLEAVRITWETVGSPTVELAAETLASRVPSVGTYEDLYSVVKYDFDGALQRLAHEYGRAGKEATLIPAYFARNCFGVSLPEQMILSVPVPAGPLGPSEATKTRARVLKAMGDATRLGMLEAIARRPRTVGELATLMGVAQPTASNHLRVLREAGLLQQTSDGDRRLEVNSEAVAEIASAIVRWVGSTA